MLVEARQAVGVVVEVMVKEGWWERWAAIDHSGGWVVTALHTPLFTLPTLAALSRGHEWL